MGYIIKTRKKELSITTALYKVGEKYGWDKNRL